MNGEEFDGIVSMLRFYSSTGHVGYIDRLASAISPIVVETTLLDALRELHSVLSTSLTVRGIRCRFDKSLKAYVCARDKELKEGGKDKEKDEEILRCCDYETLEDRYLVKEVRDNVEVYVVRERIPERAWIYGTMVKVLETEPPLQHLRGRVVMCYRCPEMPSEDEVNEFIKAVRERRFDVVRRVAALALTSSAAERREER